MALTAIAIAVGSPQLEGEGDADLNETYQRLVIEAARSIIREVPGSGPIRGEWVFQGTTYVFRDNTPGTQVLMHASSSVGWQQVDLGFGMKFDQGTVSFTEGSIVSGALSGATGTVLRQAVRIGSFGGSDAEGLLVMSNVSGSFVTGELITDAAGGTAFSSSSSGQNTLPPGGRYEFITENFGGHTNTRRMYGVNGVSTAFEYDGDVYVPIFTGMEIDEPNHLISDDNQLTLSFPGGSSQQSAIGNPYSWALVLGANEIAIGDEITGYQNLPGQTIAILARNSTHTLQGTPGNYILAEHSPDSGAIEWSAQNIGWPIFLDDRGVTDMQTTLNYGDFKSATWSELVQPIIDAKKSQVVSSVRVRSKDQYRLFFEDGTALVMCFSRGKVIGFFVFDYGKTVRVASSNEDLNGDEVLFFGSDDGFLYQMDKGTSDDGAVLTSHMRLAYNNLGAPRRRDSFRQAIVEIDADPSATIQYSQDFDYGLNQPSNLLQEFDINGGGGFWNEDNWNEFLWSSPSVATAQAYIRGTGYNMSLAIRSEAIYEEPHTISGITYYHSPKGMAR